ncbi:MAG TPA: hypothetical protein VGG39_15080 [Polyangiaceae bacterium]|jgi:hypothetical protein
MSRSLAVVRDAIDVIRRHLAALSPEVAEPLARRLSACSDEVSRWGSHPPTDPQRDSVMCRVLDIHTAVTLLLRSAGSHPPRHA